MVPEYLFIYLRGVVAPSFGLPMPLHGPETDPHCLNRLSLRHSSGLGVLYGLHPLSMGLLSPGRNSEKGSGFPKAVKFVGICELRMLGTLKREDLSGFGVGTHSANGL